ncbi:MAG TPA: hypothetical protein VII59_20785 [Streptosporangiaceae bacterium]
MALGRLAGSKRLDVLLRLSDRVRPSSRAGIVVAEAAVRGTPAIGFRVPGLRDSVLDGQTGGRGPGAVALLPWAAYRRYGWNEGGPDRRPRRWRRGGQRPRSAARPADNLARAPGVVAGSAATARPAEGG